MLKEPRYNFTSKPFTLVLSCLSQQGLDKKMKWLINENVVDIEKLGSSALTTI